MYLKQKHVEVEIGRKFDFLLILMKHKAVGAEQTLKFSPYRVHCTIKSFIKLNFSRTKIFEDFDFH